MKEEKRISLECPICDSEHSYQLTITYDPVFGLVTPQTEYHVVRRRLVFVCPTKNIKFIAIIPIKVPGRLREVSVGRRL